MSCFWTFSSKMSTSSSPCNVICNKGPPMWYKQPFTCSLAYQIKSVVAIIRLDTDSISVDWSWLVRFDWNISRVLSGSWIYRTTIGENLFESVAASWNFEIDGNTWIRSGMAKQDRNDKNRRGWCPLRRLSNVIAFKFKTSNVLGHSQMARVVVDEMKVI